MNPIITDHQETVIANSVRYIELLKLEASKVLMDIGPLEGAKPVDITKHVCKWRRFIPGRYAPVLQKVGSSQKLTIVWKDFSPGFKNKVEHYGVVVKPKLGGYSVSCFKKR